jgi:hypothetical protein
LSLVSNFYLSCFLPFGIVDDFEGRARCSAEQVCALIAKHRERFRKRKSEIPFAEIRFMLRGSRTE